VAEAKLYSVEGKLVGRVYLPDDVFGLEPNIAVVHQVVVAQRAAARAGTHSTKRRSEVSGGGAKPWRQKGTGRARAGSIRSPLWVGGGVAHGPKPRNYSQRVPKKMKKLALRSALSDLAQHDAVLAVEEWPFDDTPSTKRAATLFGSMGVSGTKVLAVVLDLGSREALSVRNLPWVKAIRVDQLTTYDVVDAEYLVADLESLGKIAGKKLDASRNSESAEILPSDTTEEVEETSDAEDDS